MKTKILSCLMAFNCLNIYPVSTTPILATGTVVPLALNAIADGKHSYAVDLAKAAAATLQSVASYETARTVLKYGSIATAISLAVHNPNHIRTAFDITKNATAGVGENVVAGVDYVIDTGKQVLNNKAKIAKVVGVVGATIALNHYIRGENSLVSHVMKNGLPGIIPSIVNQGEATASYAASMFKPVSAPKLLKK